MYTLQMSQKGTPEKTSIKDSEVGDLMIVTENSYKDHVLLRIYGNPEDKSEIYFVSLTDPEVTFDGRVDIQVRFLEPGETVTLISR